MTSCLVSPLRRAGEKTPPRLENRRPSLPSEHRSRRAQRLHISGFQRAGGGERVRGEGVLNHAQAFGQGSSGTVRMLGSVVFRLPHGTPPAEPPVAVPQRWASSQMDPQLTSMVHSGSCSSHHPFPTSARRYRPKKAGRCLRPSNSRFLAVRYSSTAEVPRESQRPLLERESHPTAGQAGT